MNGPAAVMAFIAFWISFEAVQSDADAVFPCVADVAFLIDQSRGAQEYEQFVFPFISNLTDYFVVSQSGTHEAFVYFCDPPRTYVVFEFQFQQEAERINKYMSSYPSAYEKCAGGLNSRSLELGLNLTYGTVFTPSGGMSSNVRVLIIVTTGPATDADSKSTLPVIDKLINDDGVQIFAIGIGSNITQDYLRMLTRDNALHVFMADDFPQLDQILGNVTAALGSICSSTPPWAKYCTSDIGQVTLTTGFAAAPGMTPQESRTSGTSTTTVETLAFEAVNDEKLTEKLIELSENSINATTDIAETNSGELLGLLINPTEQNLTDYNIYLTALTIYEISMAYPLTDLTFDNSVQVIDLVLGQDQRAIRRSNYLYNSTQYVQKSFNQLSAHTTPEFLVHNAVNVFVSVQEVRCDSYSPSDVVGAVQTDSSTTCIPEHSIGKAKAYHKVDAYIELPVSAICPPQLSVRDASLDTAFNSKTPIIYRVSSIVYRNVKLFGVEDPSANATSHGTGDQQMYPQSNYVTTMDLTQIYNETSGKMPIVSRRLASGGLLSFGMAVANSSDTSFLRSADRCSYWNGETWSTGGCSDAEQVVDGDMKICQCDHLTDFTIIIDNEQGDPTLDASQSHFGLTIAIIMISMIALSIALILYVVKTHRDWLPATWRETLLIK